MKKKIISIILFGLFGIVSLIAFLFFFGIFVSEVNIPLQNIFSFKDGTLCIIKLELTTDGAFVPNQNINAKVRLYKSESQLDRMGIKKIWVMFLGSSDFSKKREDGLTETLSIDLFYNPNTEIFEGESNILRYNQPGEYNFLINIDKNGDQIPEQSILSASKISIISSDILLGLKNNAWSLTIASLSLIIAIIAIIPTSFKI